LSLEFFLWSAHILRARKASRALKKIDDTDNRTPDQN
jgi:hypothetical protein